MSASWNASVCFAVVAMTILSLGFGLDHPCPLGANGGHPTDRNDLAFSPPPQEWAQSFTNGHKELVCCAQNYDTMGWKFYDNATEQWIDVKVTDQVYFKDYNQVLVFERILMEYAGWYRCWVADKHGSTIHNDIHLGVDESGGSDHPPIIIEPSHDLTILGKLQSTVNFTCRAFLGPKYQYNQLPTEFTWFKNGDVKHIIGTLNPSLWTDGRIDISLSLLPEHQVSVFTVRNLTATDFGNYTCKCDNNSPPAPKRTIQLLEGDPDALPTVEIETTDQVIPAIAGSLGCVVGALFVVACVLYVWRLDVQLFIKDHFRRPRYPDKLFDAFIVHNEDCSADQDFVLETLLPNLENELHYKLAVAERNYLPGEAIATNLKYFLENSQCVVFLVTEGMVEQEWCDCAFQIVIAQHYTNLVFITRGSIPDEMWHPDQTPFRNIMRGSKKVIEWNESNPTTAKSYNVTLFWKRLRAALPPKLVSRQPLDEYLPLQTELMIVNKN